MTKEEKQRLLQQAIAILDKIIVDGYRGEGPISARLDEAQDVLAQVNLLIIKE